MFISLGTAFQPRGAEEKTDPLVTDKAPGASIGSAVQAVAGIDDPGHII